MFGEWLKQKGISRDLSAVNLSAHNDNELLNFKLEVQKNYFAEMYAHMRKIGIKIPITGTNWSTTIDCYNSQKDMDYMDAHPYFYDWRWGEFEKYCMNKSITQEKEHYLGSSAFMVDKDRPFYVSEWDAPWPNEYRADSVIYSAAIGMFQGWSGFAIHTYSYSSKLENMKMLGKEISAEKIGNTPYRQGIFSAWNDPAKFGLFYHAALLTRRGDVRCGEELRSVMTKTRNRVPAHDYDHATEEYVLVTNDSVTPYDLNSKDKGYVESTTGELYRNYEKHYGKVDTDMTKCAFGFLGNNGVIELNGLSVEAKTDFAVVAVSSLTDKALKESDNILLTAVGRAKNANSEFEGEKMINIGEPPVLIENIEAEIALETIYSDMNVWAISAEGYYIGTVPTEYKDGKLKITLGEKSMSMYYLIVRS